MDRRYICSSCGVKWFIPGNQPERPELTTCESCGAPLIALQPADESYDESTEVASVDAGGA